jgi:hypothetical protein
MGHVVSPQVELTSLGLAPLALAEGAVVGHARPASATKFTMSSM